MKKDRTKTHGYSSAEIIIALAFILLALLIAGTLDYQDAKETAEYRKEQTK